MLQLKYLSLILIPLCVLFGYSASSQTIFLGSSEIEKHDWILTVKDSLSADVNEKIFVVSTNLDNEQNKSSTTNIHQNISTTLTSKEIQAEIVTHVQNHNKDANTSMHHQSIKHKNSIMVIGDSMAQGLQPHFDKLAKEHNISIYTRYKVGSSSFYWSNDKQIKDDIYTIQPSMVLIVLGSNEWLGSSNPKLKRAIKKLVNDIQAANTQYIWIGPPIKDALKYQQMLSETANPRYVYDYTDLNVTRSKDKIHPDRKGFSRWSEMILSKLSQEELIARN